MHNEPSIVLPRPLPENPVTKYDHVVTVPSLPEMSDMVEDLEEIWTTKQHTNNGPFVQKFEATLCDYIAYRGSVASAKVGATLVLEGVYSNHSHAAFAGSWSYLGFGNSCESFDNFQNLQKVPALL